MDTAKVFLECFPALAIVRTQVAAIKPNPGAMEPCKGMDCMSVTAGRFFVGEILPALNQAIIVLGGGASFCPLDVLMVGMQVQVDVPPLNKIGKMPLIPFRQRKLSWEQTGHGDQDPISYPNQRIMDHNLKVRGWRANFIEPLSELLSESLPASTLDAESRSLVGSWQIQGVQKAWSDLLKWWCQGSHKGPGTLESYP